MNGEVAKAGEVRTVEALLDELEERELLEAGARGDAREAAADLQSTRSEKPWYLQGLAGAGAWLAAALVVASLSCSGLVELSGIYPYIWAPVFIGVGLAVHLVRDPSEPFARQLALASTLIGEGLLVAGLYEGTDLPVTFGVFAGIVAALYPIYTADSHRFISTFGALALAAALVESTGEHGTYAALFAFELGALLLVFSEDRIVPVWMKLALRPFGYAAALSLIWVSSGLFAGEFAGLTTTWPYALAAAAGLSTFVVQAGRQFGNSWLASTGATLPVAAGLAAVSTPAIVVALTVIFVGIWRRGLALLVLGAAALVYDLGAFYYALEWTITQKSLALVGSGAVLLVIRWGLGRRLEDGEGR